MTEQERNDLQLTITHALQEMEQEAGDSFDIKKINLAELGRRTGISRKRLRNIQKNLLDTTESCKLLQCSRQNLAYLAQQGKVTPLKRDVKGNLYLKGDILKNMW